MLDLKITEKDIETILELSRQLNEITDTEKKKEIILEYYPKIYKIVYTLFLLNGLDIVLPDLIDTEIGSIDKEDIIEKGLEFFRDKLSETSRIILTLQVPFMLENVSEGGSKDDA